MSPSIPEVVLGCELFFGFATAVADFVLMVVGF